MLVGGFGDSPALKSHIGRILGDLNDEHNLDLQLIPSEYTICATGVVIGPVMRAQNKESGLKRMINFSVGRIRHLPMPPGIGVEHSDEVFA